MEYTIGFTVLWIAAILIMREVRCYRWRRRKNRRRKDQPIGFPDRRR